jgi:hypothetical protein
MMPRTPIGRKYRPRLEALEPKQLLSAGPSTRGLEIRWPAPAPPSSQAEYQTFRPCGTGTSIRIITS